MEGAEGEPSRAAVVMAWTAKVLLVGSLAWFLYASYLIVYGRADCQLRNEHRPGWTVGVVSLIAYGACCTPALFLLRRKETEWALLALVLVVAAILAPCCGLGGIVFVFGSC